MPVVGDRYRNKEHKTNITVESIKNDWVWTEGFCKIHISNFWDWFEELPTSNSQETEEKPTTKKNLQVERALEELKRELSLFQIAGKALTSGNLGNSLSINYKHLANAAQNLVNVLEAEKKPFFKVREEGQFEGSPPTKETFARHEETIKRMKEGLKEECVEPVSKSIWHDRKIIFEVLKEINQSYPKELNRLEINKHTAIALEDRNIVNIDESYLCIQEEGRRKSIHLCSFTFELTFQDIGSKRNILNISKFCSLIDFVNQAEDMEARLRKLEGK